MSFLDSNPNFKQRKIHMDIILRSLEQINKLKEAYPKPYDYEGKLNGYYGQITKRLRQWNEANSLELPTKLEILELYVNPYYNTYTQLYDIYVNNHLNSPDYDTQKQIYQTALQTMTDVLKRSVSSTDIGYRNLRDMYHFTKYSLDIKSRGQPNRTYVEYPWRNPRAKLPPLEDILFEGGYTSNEFRSQVSQSIINSGYRSLFTPAGPSPIKPTNLADFRSTPTYAGDFPVNSIAAEVINRRWISPPDEYNYIQKYLKYKNKYLNLKYKQ